MKLSVNQKKKEKKGKKRKRENNDKSSNHRFLKKYPMQRFVTLTFNMRLFPHFLSMSLKKILTIQQFCYPRVQSLPIWSLQNFLTKTKRRKYTQTKLSFSRLRCERACFLYGELTEIEGETRRGCRPNVRMRSRVRNDGDHHCKSVVVVKQLTSGRLTSKVYNER